MSQVVIENPVINSPFTEPTRHFRFSDEGITNELIDGRRTSSYFVPIARPKKKASQRSLFETEWTQERIQENKLINDIRYRVGLWRKGGYVGVTPTTAHLLAYWTDPDREKKLFFCQIEALETVIYLTEVARKYGDAWLENALREANDTSNPGLPRLALKMATGSGKTVVMAMLIAWHTLNKAAYPQDARFSNSFLLITPGITIRDRLRVLLPNDPQNYYRQRDILPVHEMEQLGQAKILITNFHAFQLREKVTAGKITKSILAEGAGGAGQSSAFTETPDQMVRRVCRELGTKKNIVVINDEAHHCYRRKPDGEEEKLTGEERVEAKKREQEARVWISGIEAVKAKLGVKTIYDLSATPFFLRGSGYDEGTLFPWVISDFSLIDAIEAGIVKVPRVPVADDSMTGEQPTYRDLWLRIREDLPKKGRKTDAIGGEPKLPAEMQGALHSLYSNYEKYYHLWEQNGEAHARGITPPVFIVVCNNTNVSKLVYDYVAGWEKQIGEQTIIQAGQLPIFRNDDGRGNRRVRVCGPFSVESLSPHRVLSTADEDHNGTVSQQEAHQQQDFATMILDNLKKAGVQNTRKQERLTFDRLDPYAGVWLHATGEYTDADGHIKRTAVSIGPEQGTVGPQQVKEAAKEAVQGVGFDLLIVCGFAFDPHVSEEVKRYGRLTVLPAKMNPDLAMGDELLKKTGAGNLFMVFGEPDVEMTRQADGQIVVEIKGVDVYDPTTGQIRNSSTDDIACWFIDTAYNGESFFVRHAYFTGADEPYDKLKRALRADIDEAAWSVLYSTVGRPFVRPETGKIAVKVINHYGDEVLKVFAV